jgi:hypothetical protein
MLFAAELTLQPLKGIVSGNTRRERKSVTAVGLFLLLALLKLHFIMSLTSLSFFFFSFQCDKIRQERDEAVKKLEEFQKSM